MPIPILLDTDLGSDPDDELALALLWGSPEVAVRGVSTTYGDVDLRARIAGAMAALVRRPLTIAPGHGTPESGREVWWAGHEGDAYALAPELPDPSRWAEPSPGALLLSNGCRGAEILAIAPLTTVAAAIELGLDGVRGVTVMGGDWSDPSAVEHNIASDHVAAQRVLGSGLPITVVGLDVTRQVRFGEAEIARFEACGELGRIIGAEIRAWMIRWDEDFEVPHDALTALAILEPERFEFTPPVAIEVSDDGAVRRLDRPGTVRIATGVDVDAARTAMADRIAAGLSVS